MPSAGLLQIVVEAPEAAVELRTAPGEEVIVESSGQASADVRENTLRIRLEGKGRLRVTARPDLDLVVRKGKTRKADKNGSKVNLLKEGKDGTVDVRGSWGKLRVEGANGDVTVDIDDCASAKITAHGGSIRFSVKEAPGGSVHCVSTHGSVDLRAPSTYRGTVSLSTNKGKITVADDPRVEVRSSSATAVNAFVGKRFTLAEHKESPVDKRPAFWGQAPVGNVTFTLAD